LSEKVLTALFIKEWEKVETVRRTVKVGSSFNRVGGKQIERVLDSFHINKAIREAYGKEIDVPDTLKT